MEAEFMSLSVSGSFQVPGLRSRDSKIRTRNLIPRNPCPVSRALYLVSKEANPNQKLGDEKIDYDDEHRGNHHGLCRGASHALCPAGGVQPLVASDQGDDKGKEEGFDKP